MLSMSASMLAKREQLTSDISVLLTRIREIHNEEVLNRNDLRNNILDRNRYSEKLSCLQEEQKTWIAKYECLIMHPKKESVSSPYKGFSSGRHYSFETDTSLPVLMYDDTSELREVSNRLAEIKQQMSELKEAIRQLEVRIEEGIQSRYRIRDLWKDLEDINTKRLSLRIQLSQLIKERSLLLSNTKIVSIVC